MPKLKRMCDLIAELIGELRNEAEVIPCVYKKTAADTIKVFAEHSQGIVRYTIKVKDITVKEVFNEYLERDLVDLASVEAVFDSNSQLFCSGSLFYTFADGDDLFSNYEMDLFRYVLKVSIRKSLQLTEE